MSWAETFRTALEAVRAHRMRSVLTMLGIVIGIASVTLTVGLGQGAQQEVEDEIASLGSHLLIVSPGSSTGSDGTRGGFGSASTLTTADAAALAGPDAVPDAAAVAAVTSTSAAVTAGSTSWTTSVVGTSTTWLDVRARSLDAGRFFTEAEASGAAAVAVLGPDTASELFGDSPTSPVGETVTVDGAELTVIGVLEATGTTSTTASEDDQVVVPMGTAAALTGSSSSTQGLSVSTIYVEATDAGTLSAAYQEVEALLLSRHATTSDEADFTLTTQDSLLETANATNETFTVLLGGVAGISLLVGGIGVMNIMLVSVTERVREIGLRKALGAPPRAIRRQFLVEASVLGLTGGALGVLVGAVGALVLPPLIDQAVTLSLLATLAALATSLALGVGFGVYPATRAARLAPIDALRAD